MTAPHLLALWCEPRTLGLRPTYTDKASLPHSPFSTTEVVPFPLDGETSLRLKPEAAVLIPKGGAGQPMGVHRPLATEY